MKYMPIAGLCLASMLVLSMALAGSAAAILWLFCEKGTSGVLPTKYTTNQCTTAASGNKGEWESVVFRGLRGETVRLAMSVRLEDTKGEPGAGMVVKCDKVSGPGAIYEGENILVVGELSAAKPSAECTAEGTGVFKECKTSKLELVTLFDHAVELQIYEEKGKLVSRLEPRYPDEPVWEVWCAGVNETCTLGEGAGKFEELGIANTVSVGVLLVSGEFLKKHHGECTAGGKEAGVIEGRLAILSKGGNGLSITKGGGATAACNVNKERWVFCSGNSEISTQILKATIGNPAILDSKIKGIEVEIKCTTGKFEPILERSGTLTVADKFESCTVPKPAGTCTISGSAIKSDLLFGGLEGPVGGPPELEFDGLERMSVVKIEGCAAIEGEYTLKGKQGCKVDFAYKTEQAEHEFNCEKAGSALELSTEKATLSMTAKGPLVEGGNWSMQLN